MPKQFVSSAGWQPAAPSSGETIRFVCGLAACSGLMCRNSSFRLRARCNQAGQYWVRAGSPQRPQVAKQFVSSAGWQPAAASCAETVRFVCMLAARCGLMRSGSSVLFLQKEVLDSPVTSGSQPMPEIDSLEHIQPPAASPLQTSRFQHIRPLCTSSCCGLPAHQKPVSPRQPAAEVYPFLHISQVPAGCQPALKSSVSACQAAVGWQPAHPN